MLTHSRQVSQPHSACHTFAKSTKVLWVKHESFVLTQFTYHWIQKRQDEEYLTARPQSGISFQLFLDVSLTCTNKF